MTLASRSIVRAAAAVAAAVLALLVTATLAAAHTTLRDANPEEGATVDELTEVRLTFNGDLLDIGSELSIVDAAGGVHELEPEFPASNAVAAPVEPTIAEGPAELIWRVVAEDGHPIEGTIGFTYAPDGASEPAEPTQPAEPTEPAVTVTDPEPTAAASDPEPSATGAVTDADATAEPGATEDAGDETGGVPAWVWPVIAVAALVGAGLSIAVTKLRGRS